MTWRTVPTKQLHEPVLTREDFYTVLDTVKASVSQDDLKKYKEWTEQFGSEGA
jgi:vacuolar protein-sorting-associated protein 4